MHCFGILIMASLAEVWRKIKILKKVERLTVIQERQVTVLATLPPKMASTNVFLSIRLPYAAQNRKKDKVVLCG